MDCGKIKEIFLDFVALERTTGEKIAEAILLCIQNNNIDIAKARGQAYDGTGSMSSEQVGVQSRIRLIAPPALYTNCRSHVLNLSIAAACKVASIKNMVGFINENYLFFDLSPKRQRFLNMFCYSVHRSQ